MELRGKVEKYAMSEAVHFTFRQESKNDEDYGETMNIPFEIYNKFKGNNVKIIIEKIKD